MKKVLLFSLLALLFLSCEKEDKPADELKSLAGTEWTGSMPDYYDGSVVVKGISSSKATLTAGVTTVAFNYTYNSTLKTGVLTSEGVTFTFEITGNSLKVTDEYNDSYNFTRTK
jgi:hypothetical protein